MVIRRKTSYTFSPTCGPFSSIWSVKFQQFLQKRMTDSESRMTAMRGLWLRGGGIEQKGRTHGHGQQCGDWGEWWGIIGVSGNGEIYNN